MKRKIIGTLLCVGLSCTLFGCSITSRLARRQVTVHLAQLSRTQRQEQQETERPQILRVQRDSTDYFFLPVEKDENGEDIGSVQIEQVVVVARIRPIPERRGKVTIDFNVNLPKELLGRSRSVVITPYLHKLEQVVAMDDIIIRGALFDKVQQRDYWQYNTYLGRFRPDSLRAEWAFSRFVKYPYPQDARLDSLVEHRTSISYYYSQEVSTDETSKKMLITLRGKVEALDESDYAIPPSDTLVYAVSSMLSFLDTMPRYCIRIIDKYVSVQDRNYILFRVDDTRLIDTLGDNARELNRITSLMDRIVSQREFYVDSVILTASASPEGRWSSNLRLSGARAGALRRYLAGRFGRRIDTLLTVRATAEDWPELAAQIRKNPHLLHRDEILHLIATEKNPDRRERLIRERYPAEYRYLKEKIYPSLRAVTMRYDLRRVGMVKDTIHTTELDTAYMRGRELLEQRRYPQALYILRDYDDRNTAIAHLSLGHDAEALRILDKLPASAVTEYLKAIACARLGHKTAGREHFLEACRRDERMEYRATLDPEINDLLRE